MCFFFKQTSLMFTFIIEQRPYLFFIFTIKNWSSKLLIKWPSVLALLHHEWTHRDDLGSSILLFIILYC